MGNELGSLNVIFTEFYYWVTIVFMFLIHAGLGTYEVGATRRKSMLHTLMKSILAIPLVTITFFFSGGGSTSPSPTVPASPVVLFRLRGLFPGPSSWGLTWAVRRPATP